MKPILLAFVMLVAGASAHGAEEAPRPFRAEYESLRNGDVLGRTTLSLADNRDGTWTLRSETRGTSGLARLADVRVTETSRFRLRDGRPESLEYAFRQESSLRDRARDIGFDHDRGEVRTREKGKTWRYALVPGLIDRPLVTLALRGDLARSAPQLQYAIATKDHVETRTYRRTRDEQVSVPAGDFDAARVEYRGGKDGRRTIVGWYAPALDWLPVRIEQTEGDGERMELRLLSPPAH